MHCLIVHLGLCLVDDRQEEVLRGRAHTASMARVDALPCGRASHAWDLTHIAREDELILCMSTCTMS